MSTPVTKCPNCGLKVGERVTIAIKEEEIASGAVDAMRFRGNGLLSYCNLRIGGKDGNRGLSFLCLCEGNRASVTKRIRVQLELF